MEKSLTQRMDWLHTWFGLVLGWLAFALFLTGTIAVFWFEIQHWAQPELHGAKMLSPEATVQYSVDFHWTFNREVPDLQGRTFRWTYMLSGFVGVAFLVCTITGLVVHKKIFRIL